MKICEVRGSRKENLQYQTVTSTSSSEWFLIFHRKSPEVTHWLG
jgi:hypothetical protein